MFINIQRTKNAFLLLGTIAFALTLAACSKEVQPQPSQPAAGEPVTIETNGMTIAYPQAPQRAVTLNQHVTEVMLALGLEDKMVGTAYLDDAILPQWEEAYAKIPVLSDKYPNKEVLMAAEPDFVYAGWKSGFGDQGVGTMEELEQMGIKPYLHMSSNMTGPTMDDVFADIRNIGRIFRIDDRAEELIAQMKAEMDDTVSKIESVDKPLTVFVYDSGEDKPKTAASNNYMTHLIELAGGKNIFDDIEKGWPAVSWEEVVDRKPDVIVVVDYGNTSVEQKREFLLAKRELAEVPAIANQRLIVLPLSAAAEGVRAPIALKMLAEGFYPERFQQ
ncbi:ABC transporter substrate-binding protein [Brevibacillus sp. TJ4]|uniref:ABC transporter substrate-binding protein n=1 Tax=Brevibacillus sp. TJ4 TaxID=3234853 RepID=UPI0037D92D4E